MDDFSIWTLSPQPQIDKEATFSKVAQLGIFACQYQISALTNQATDIIRGNLAHGHWQLQASIVDDIYAATAPTGSPLREVIRAALELLPRSSVEGEGQVQEEWKATFIKHSHLGWDYCQAVGRKWGREDYLSGACRFHDHQGAPHQDVSHQEEWCAYAREECFPTWEDKSMRGRKDETGWKEQGTMDQERCKAGEERKDMAM